jgi:IS5 family transposase
MRSIVHPQLSLGETDISNVQLDVKSRDAIPQILRGLQYLYKDLDLRRQMFAILEEVVPDRPGEGATRKVDTCTGQPGMEQWKILVLGSLRLGLNADYDRIRELANQHVTIRQLLGHSDWADDCQYELQTIKDNVRLLTPDILDRINRLVVDAGHSVLGKDPEEPLRARADSFVVKTHVHYPTDINLLLDAVRKTIETGIDLTQETQLTA